MASPKEAQQTLVKRYHDKNNAVAWQKYQLAHKPEVKGDNGWIKEENAYTQAMLNPKKKRDAKNEDPITHPHHKKLNEQQNTQQNQTNSQAMANAWMPDQQWTHMEVEHAQGSGITHLYPANIEVVVHGSKVREGMIWQWGERGSVFWGSRSSSFGGNVLLGWHTTQKKKKWVGITRSML